MTDGERPGEVLLVRRFNNDRATLSTSGGFAGLFRAWRDHAALWEGEPDGLATVMMHQGLAGASLHVVNRPRDESLAWTINFQQPATNLFLTADARLSAVTGRVFTENVRTADTNRLFFQSIRPGSEPRESVCAVSGLDVLVILDQYYATSEQNPARFFELESDQYLMVLGMPGADREWIAHLDRETAQEHHRASSLLEERLLRFECGCTPRKMHAALRRIFGRNPDELFQGEDRVETSCPRCGRRWWVRREQFQRET